MRIGQSENLKTKGASGNSVLTGDFSRNRTAEAKAFLESLNDFKQNMDLFRAEFHNLVDDYEVNKGSPLFQEEQYVEFCSRELYPSRTDYRIIWSKEAPQVYKRVFEINEQWHDANRRLSSFIELWTKQLGEFSEKFSDFCDMEGVKGLLSLLKNFSAREGINPPNELFFTDLSSFADRVSRLNFEFQRKPDVDEAVAK